MTGLAILLDTERFPLPEQNNRILEMFFSIKHEMLKSLKGMEMTFIASSAILVVTIKPTKVGLDYIIEDKQLERDIANLLSEKMDLTKTADQILKKDLN